MSNCLDARESETNKQEEHLRFLFYNTIIINNIIM